MGKKMKKQPVQVIKKPTEKDIGFLLCTHEFRVLTLLQVRRFVDLTEYYSRRKKKLLIDSGYLQANAITGGYQPPPGQLEERKAYSITGKGVSLLRKHGHDITLNADALRIPKAQLPYLLTSYDLAFYLCDHGWQFEQSRYYKARLNLNRQGVVKGMLTSPAGVNWVFFVTLSHVNKSTLAKFKQEMESASGNYFDKAIFTKDMPALEAIVEFFKEEESLLRFLGSCKVLPQFMVEAYVRYMSTDEEFFSFLQAIGYPVTKRETTHLFEQWITEDGFIAVNLLDTDLVKVHEMLSYTDYQLERIKGFKVFTTPKLVSVHHQLLGHLKHVHFQLMEEEIIEEHFTEKRAVH
ncbi:hypothetical protein MKX47_20305 [Solibacillus sp. FSL R7-0668]|uniref:hypothetical protein n=1 Tax=Solibacillus sp. FSL R7-0668 TaxID=2921688 RepID=UPI0030F6B535